MINFNKDYRLWIVWVIITIVCLYITPLYSYPTSKDSLRLEVGQGDDTYGRVEEARNGLSDADVESSITNQEKSRLFRNRSPRPLDQLRDIEFSYARLVEGKVSIERRKVGDIAEFGDDEVVVKIERMGICRADVKELYAGRDIPEDRGPLFGHELVGGVVFAGKNTGVRTGQRATFNPNVTPDRTTGFAEYFIIKGEGVKEALNVVEDEKLSSDIAVFSEPFSCVVRSIDKLLGHMGRDDLSDKKVAVIGAGNAGMYHVWLAQRLGAKVTVLNIDDGRLNFIEERGLFDGDSIIFDESKDVQEDLTGHEGEYDVVVVVPTRVTPKTLRLSSRLVTDDGYIHIYAGTRKGDSFGGVDIDSVRRSEGKEEAAIESKRAFVTGAYGTQPDDFQRAFALLRDPELAERMRKMISKIISLDELPKFIMAMAKGITDPPGKVVILPTGRRTTEMPPEYKVLLAQEGIGNINKTRNFVATIEELLREDSERPVRVVAFDRIEMDALEEALKEAGHSFEYFKGMNVKFSLIAADEARLRLLEEITPYESKGIGGMPFYSVTDQIEQAHQIWQDIEDGV